LISNIRSYDDKVSGDDGPIASVFIRFDQRYYIYNRQVYSILNMLGDVGGLQQALYMIGLLVLSYFTKRLFVSQLLKELYQTKFNRGVAS
jgi:hypothetical protein